MTTSNDAPQPRVEKSSAEDAWRVFLAINDWIKHADAKIAGTLAAAGVIAGVLYNVASGLEHPPIVTTVFITTTGVFLLIAVIFAGLALLSPARVMGPLVCHEHGTSSSSGHGPC
ncbi:hypothetical protein [Mycobacterium avium]|uniref:hypothetical protein n=2 Tax=Mycobacterium avium TaxID=1764 RepID=UPI001F226D28|nr:hypothetical protein [Mycobacterium avium]